MGYLKSWESSVKKRKGYTAREKKKMLMPDETLQGIAVTGNCDSGFTV